MGQCKQKYKAYDKYEYSGSQYFFTELNCYKCTRN